MIQTFLLTEDIYKASIEKGVYKNFIHENTFCHLHREITEAAFNSSEENLKEEISDIAILILSYSKYRHIDLRKLCMTLINSNTFNFNDKLFEYCIEHFNSFKKPSYISERFLEMHKLASDLWNLHRKGMSNAIFVKLAQIYLFVCGFCIDYDIDLNTEMVKKHEKFKKREYKSFYAA